MSATPNPPGRALVQAVQGRTDLDRLAGPAFRIAARAVGHGRTRAALSGDTTLGHPLHPALTDLPIGFWTSAMVLDVIGGGKAGRPASRLLIGAGVVAAIPTAVTGWSDFTAIRHAPMRRVAVVHAGSNITALLLYIASWRMRGRGHWLRGMATAMAAAGIATIAGTLGGALAFGDDVDVDDPGPDARHQLDADGIVDLTGAALEEAAASPH